MKRLERLKGALLSVCDNVGHQKELKKTPPYIVWQEDGANGIKADNRLAEQSLQGTIHLFTAVEYDPLADKMQAALDEVGCAWYLSSIQQEEETGWTHHEWVWEM